MEIEIALCKHTFVEGVCSRCEAWQDGDCKHLFVIGEKREHASCNGTHRAHCKNCGMNYYYYVVEVYSEACKTGKKRDDEYIHVCVFDSDDMKACCSTTGECPLD